MAKYFKKQKNTNILKIFHILEDMFVLLKIIINSCKEQTKKCCYKLFNYWEEFLWWVGWGLKQYKVLYSDQSYRLQWVDNFNPLLISIKQLLIIITPYTMVCVYASHNNCYLERVRWWDRSYLSTNVWCCMSGGGCEQQ